MTPDEFRALALAKPGATESTHAASPGFRRAGKIFATLGSPDARWGMVRLRPDQQETLIAVVPDVFRPANGAWGLGGRTLIHLERIDEQTAAKALQMAWDNAAK